MALVKPVTLRMGERTVEVMPDGRVLVTLPVSRVPFGAIVWGTIVYENLKSLTQTMRRTL